MSENFKLAFPEKQVLSSHIKELKFTCKLSEAYIIEKMVLALNLDLEDYSDGE